MNYEETLTDKKRSVDQITKLVDSVHKPIGVIGLGENDVRVSFGQYIEGETHQISVWLRTGHFAQWHQLPIVVVPFFIFLALLF